ncbi:MAG: CBS domain-containing protein [Methanocalculus sp. MSAO_Arc2]|uniref:CBS domain-containing protein n=1 Tax=Methanocalculus sp. MSAO_Arc2 TaxID=2293855 RepID=UPI000FEE2017|nr:MAG: CBS domain-containing protein [Methanocalculus sp. MSAO_Arc2]
MIVRDYMMKNVVTADTPANRDEILKILKRTGISGVPVMKEGNLIGIITRKDLLRNPHETQIALLMTPDPITIDADATLCEAAEVIIRHNVRRLPVIEDGRLVGLISVADLIGAVAQMKIQDEIKDRYVSRTFALWNETPLNIVGRIMEIAHVDAISILDSDNRLDGIITERDLIRCSCIEDDIEISDFSNGTDDDEWTWESIRDMHMISYGISRIQLPLKPVRLAMVKKVIAVPTNAGVSECALKMKRGRVDQLPIVNGDRRLVAMLYDRELIRALIDYNPQ